ncbi:SGNH/GDSL hydrolase family protein [Wenzhouxiangella sp. XN79A]|uniref:SGNH/GDSL hydrolase family protein n=1 Tax=Wenzhouxiangella sp. XN79A TaxID=2724193 RepID=UPI00144ADFC9|nr:SGNH/GDSL hydrolase family protein [Wenzhouxiangella sp. XN79A]NKI34355.1 SGNH/GDSL hydrolase family protein [Wenzhouxiangella sp. XN79A]
MRSLQFWALFALALPAALRTRRTAVRAEGAAGPETGAVGDGPTLRLVGLGDSIIAGVGASTHAVGLVGRTAEALAELERVRVEWTAVGRSGLTSTAIRERLLPTAPLHDADAIIVSAGVNDLTRLSGPVRFRTNLGMLLDALEVAAPSARIALAGLPPLETFPALPPPLKRAFGLRGRQLDRIMQQVVAGRPRAAHAPVDIDPVAAADRASFSADGFHPSEASYIPFGRGLAVALHALSSTGNT